MDANSRQDAVLMLSSVNLPGGVQVGSFFFFFFKLKLSTDDRLLIYSNDVLKSVAS